MSKKFVLFLQLLSCSILLSSFTLEYRFFLTVCSLCIIQRFLWVFLIFITLIIRNRGIVLLILLASILVSFYQLLMQYNFISAVCSINFDTMEATVSCADKDFLIMGLPLSFYNLIINLTIFIYIFKKHHITKKRERDDKLFEEESF